jgi:predicted dehydrogenase
MGKRRTRLIHELYPDYTICGIDGRVDRRSDAEKEFGIKTFPSTADIDTPVDCAFVCTSPSSHAEIIEDCLKRDWHVFTELNLIADGYEQNIRLAEEKKKTLFLSSTFLYREETRYLRTKIIKDARWNYIYHIGQYLPDWHPWENYKDFFVGDKRTNGCREILSIELPWLSETFGRIEDFKVESDKISSLNIGFNDNYMISFTHSGGNKGLLVVDVVSPVAVRKLEAYTEGQYFAWNGTPETLFAFNPQTKTLDKVDLSEKAERKEGYSSFIVENAYKNEIREFFDVVLNGKMPIYGFEQDKSILGLIDKLGA